MRSWSSHNLTISLGAFTPSKLVTLAQTISSCRIGLSEEGKKNNAESFVVLLWQKKTQKQVPFNRSDLSKSTSMEGTPPAHQRNSKSFTTGQMDPKNQPCSFKEWTVDTESNKEHNTKTRRVLINQLSVRLTGSHDNETQPSKAFSPMWVTDSPKVMLAREVHSRKACAPR